MIALTQLDMRKKERSHELKTQWKKKGEIRKQKKKNREVRGKVDEDNGKGSSIVRASWKSVLP